jgi:transposase
MLLSEGHTLYRVHLTEEQAAELLRRARSPATHPRTRERLEMIRLVAAGWSVPRVARHFGRDARRFRERLRAFWERGFAALEDPPHLGQQSSFTPELRAALRDELAKGDRTWTTQQIADWLAEHHGLRLSADWLGRLLKREKFSYQRTQRHLRHKQDPARVAAKRRELETLKKGEATVGWTSAM